MIKGMVASLAALSLAAAPAMAQTSASRLSVVGAARADASVDGEKLGGNTLLIVAAVAAAVALAVFVVFDDDDDSESP